MTGVDTSAITDDVMRAGMARTRGYTLVLLRQGPRYGADGSAAVVWEHGRRNFALRAAGELAIVCPVTDDSELCGMGVFTGSVEETAAVMDADPGVVAGVFSYEVHPVRSFPGDVLPP